MKKKAAAIVMTALLLMMTAVPTFAYVKDPVYSPGGELLPTGGGEDSPKTGESDVLLYGIGAAAVCGTVIVISGKKLKES